MKKTHIIAIVMIAVAIAAISISIGDSSSYEDFTTAINNPEEEYHVVGVLDESQPLHYKPQEDPNYFSFHMIDNKGKRQKVVYYDAKPQDFERSDQIVIVGKMGDEAFEASKILMKCPSKYQEDEIQIKEASVKS